MSTSPAALIGHLREQTQRTRVALEHSEAVFDRAEQLSDALKQAGTLLGLDSPLARRLLSLREELDSHLLTAAAIEGCHLEGAAATSMICRGVDAVAAGLPVEDSLLTRLAVH